MHVQLVASFSLSPPPSRPITEQLATQLCSPVIHPWPPVFGDFSEFHRWWGEHHQLLRLWNATSSIRGVWRFLWNFMTLIGLWQVFGHARTEAVRCNKVSNAISPAVASSVFWFKCKLFEGTNGWLNCLECNCKAFQLKHDLWVPGWLAHRLNPTWHPATEWRWCRVLPMRFWSQDSSRE